MWKMLSFAALSFGAVSSHTAQVRTSLRGTETPAFQRGVNILAYDPLWKNPNKGRFQLKHFAEIRRGGFDFVRVNLLVFEHMDAQGQINPQWLKRLDWVIANATKAGLGVILDEHDSNACKKDVAACPIKLAAVWRQLASRYVAEPKNVAFELLNEPDSAFDTKAWNEQIPKLLSIIRESNPARIVVVAQSPLEALRLPRDDRNIIATFHYYGPFRFTHQGARWTKLKDLRGVTWGSRADRQTVRNLLDKISAWSHANQRPILLGEFGVFDGSGIPLAMRVDYTGFIACEAERRGFGWSYWQFDSNFIVWDMKRDDWVVPIKEALIPRHARAANC